MANTVQMETTSTKIAPGGVRPEPAAGPTTMEQMLAAVEQYEKNQAPNVDGNPLPTPATVTAPEPPKAAPPTQEVPKPPTQDDIPALERIARREKALRDERQQVEPYIQALRVMPPATVQALTKALSSRDPVSALAALGFTHAEYTNRLLDGATGPAPAPKPSTTPTPPKELPLPEEFKQEIEELRQFKRQFEAERAERARVETLGKVAEVVKANPKFKYVAGLENYGAVVDTIQRYYTETGSLPGSTFEESVTMAAELVERNLAQAADKWSKLLTPAGTPTTVPPTKAPESPAPSPGAEIPRTLNNGAASTPSSARPEPKTHEERLAALLSDPVFLAME